MQNKKLVRDLELQKVKTIRDSETVTKAVQSMKKNKIGALIVVDSSGHTVGIFTERDLLNKVVAESLSMDTLMSKVMTQKLICAQLHDELSAIPDLMIKGGFRHVPVLDGFEPVGIISIRDVLKYIKEASI